MVWLKVVIDLIPRPPDKPEVLTLILSFCPSLNQKCYHLPCAMKVVNCLLVGHLTKVISIHLKEKVRNTDSI